MRSRNIIFVFSAVFAVSAVNEIMLVAESRQETQRIERIQKIVDRRRLAGILVVLVHAV